MDAPSRVAHRQHERLRRVHRLRPQILPRVDVVHDLHRRAASAWKEKEKREKTHLVEERDEADGVAIRARWVR